MVMMDDGDDVDVDDDDDDDAVAVADADADDVADAVDDTIEAMISKVC